MSQKVFKHRRFLSSVSENPSLISNASTAEIGCLIEILHNLDKIALSAKEQRILTKLLPLIRKLAAIRKTAQAREQLTQHGGSLLPLIIPAALSLLLS